MRRRAKEYIPAIQLRLVQELLTDAELRFIAQYELPAHLASTVEALVVARRHPRALDFRGTLRAGWPRIACDLFRRRPPARDAKVVIESVVLESQVRKCERIAKDVAAEARNAEYVASLPVPEIVRPSQAGAEAHGVNAPRGYSTTA